MELEDAIAYALLVLVVSIDHYVELVPHVLPERLMPADRLSITDAVVGELQRLSPDNVGRFVDIFGAIDLPELNVSCDLECMFPRVVGVAKHLPCIIHGNLAEGEGYSLGKGERKFRTGVQIVGDKRQFAFEIVVKLQSECCREIAFADFSFAENGKHITGLLLAGSGPVIGFLFGVNRKVKSGLYFDFPAEVEWLHRDLLCPEVSVDQTCEPLERQSELFAGLRLPYE